MDPLFFAGRSAALDRALLSVATCMQGRATQSLCYYGLCGVGKTVLLGRVRDEASAVGAQSLTIEARASSSLAGLLAPSLKQLLVSLSYKESAKENAESAMRTLRSFVNSIKVKFHDVEISLDVPPEKGSADSGNFHQDLTELLCRIGEVAKKSHTAVILIVDEIQFLAKDDLAALIESLHIIGQRNLPLLLIGAGLPVILARSAEAKTYSERLFEFMELGPLPAKDALEALREPAAEQGVSFTSKAAKFIIEATQGYPYFVQLWGRFAWASANENAASITLKNARGADQIARAALDASFFRSRMDRVTPKEKAFLFAMSEINHPSVKMSDVAQKMNVKLQALSPLRSKLMEKGVIYSPRYGEVAYSVPLFDDYLRRIKPKNVAAE